MKFPRETKTLENGCIIFLGHNKFSETAKQQKFSFRDDYRCVLMEGSKWPSHRLSYSLNVASIPKHPVGRREGLVLHTCDNKWCINPSHLYLGTQAQNISDTLNRHATFKSCRVGRLHTPETKAKISETKRRQNV